MSDTAKTTLTLSDYERIHKKRISELRRKQKMNQVSRVAYDDVMTFAHWIRSLRNINRQMRRDSEAIEKFHKRTRYEHFSSSLRFKPAHAERCRRAPLVESPERRTIEYTRIYCRHCNKEIRLHQRFYSKHNRNRIMIFHRECAEKVNRI